MLDVCVGLDVCTSSLDFALLEWENKRRQTNRHTKVFNLFNRQVSKLAKVNENLPVVLYQAPF